MSTKEDYRRAVKDLRDLAEHFFDQGMTDGYSHYCDGARLAAQLCERMANGELVEAPTKPWAGYNSDAEREHCARAVAEGLKPLSGVHWRWLMSERADAVKKLMGYCEHLENRIREAVDVWDNIDAREDDVELRMTALRELVIKS